MDPVALLNIGDEITVYEAEHFNYKSTPYSDEAFVGRMAGAPNNFQMHLARRLGFTRIDLVGGGKIWPSDVGVGLERGPAVEIRVLGEVALYGPDGSSVKIPRVGERIILAKLAIDARKFVQTSTLLRLAGENEAGIDKISPDTLKGYVSGVRKALKAAGAPGVLSDGRKRPGGFCLDIDPDLVDYGRLRTCAQEANARAKTRDYLAAVELYRCAVSEWAGRPLAGIEGAHVDGVRQDLWREYRAASVGLIKNLLDLGEPGEAATIAWNLIKEDAGTDIVALGLHALSRSGQMGEFTAFCNLATQQHRRLTGRLTAELPDGISLLSTTLIDNPQASFRLLPPGPTPPARPDPVHGVGRSWDGCPYLGLLPYEERHARVFFGRQELTRRLLDRLEHRLFDDSGLLLVTGPSGAGKSSVLRAGLLAALANDRLAAGCAAWPRRVLTPTANPVGQLAACLADLTFTDAIDVHRSLAARPEDAHLLVLQALRTTSDAVGVDRPRLVLVVDQLEELFSLTDDPHQRSVFLTALHALASTPLLPDGRPGALVVAGIRVDFMNQALDYQALRAAFEARPITVGPMQEAELRQAITAPAAQAGVDLPPDLATAILDDLRDRNLSLGFDSGTLPLLSQVMFTMWQEGLDNLTVAGYRATGGVANIVRASADKVYGELNPTEQEIARRVFLQLTDAADGRLTRRPAKRAMLCTAAGATAEEVNVVLDAFADRRLITLSDEGTVDIAHEELLKAWTRLREWLQPSLTDQALHRALIDDAHTWQQHSHESSYLYRGGQLHAVTAAARRWGADLGTKQLVVGGVAVEFLTASRRRDRRRRTLYQAIAVAMTLLVILTGTAAVIASRNAARADQQHALALSRQLAAQSRVVASTSRWTAQRLAAAALHSADTAEAREAAQILLTDFRNVLHHPAAVTDLVFSPDSKLLATTSADAKVRLWDPATGYAIGAPLKGHIDSITSATFSPRGDLLATASEDGTVLLWNPTTGRPVGASSIGHADSVSSVAFSSNGNRLATASADKTVRLWNPDTGQRVGEPLTGHTGPVNSVAFSPDGNRLATASADTTVRLWNPDTGQGVGEPLTGHTRPVLSVAFSPDGNLLATGSADFTARLWDAHTGEAVGDPLKAHSDSVFSVAFSPDGDMLATASADGTVRLRNLKTGEEVTLGGHSNQVTSATFSRDGKMLATASTDGTARLWDPQTRRAIGAPLTGHTGQVNSVAFSRDGKLLASGSDDQTIQLWDPITGHSVGAPLRGHKAAVWSVAFSPRDNLLASASFDGTVRLWDDPENGGTVRELTGHNNSIVWQVAFSPDGEWVASAGVDGTARLWDPNTGREVHKLTAHNASVTSVTFSPDGRLLATASADGTVRLWDPQSGEAVGDPLTGPIGTPVLFSPDGRLLATGWQLWDLRTRHPLATVSGRTGSLDSLAFSPNGKLFASARVGTTVQLWDPQTGRALSGPLTGHTGRVLNVAFSPDGRLLATTSDDRTVRLWDVSLHLDPLRSLCAQAGGPTEDEWATYAPGEPFQDVCQ
ncbi:MAG TPA: AAA family ATPase [Candidatus Limnocylindrales bacterium]|nr:AAA family ATPase [Candidatus Limnocylindrales bacterium]